MQFKMLQASTCCKLTGPLLLKTKLKNITNPSFDFKHSQYTTKAIIEELKGINYV